MRPVKTIYYSDPLHDDFAGNHIDTQQVGADFPFVHQSRLWNKAAWRVYYIIAIPLVFLICKCYLGLKFENRKAVRKLPKGTGFFLYGNHTRNQDAFLPSMAAFPRKAYVIAGPDAVSIRGIRNLVQMLGVIPIPTGVHAMKEFLEAVYQRSGEGQCVAMFPEAHIWPFYTGIRPFPDTSFRYPVKSGLPMIAMVTTYRTRRGLFRFCRKPGMTVTLSDPIYPDPELAPKAAQAKLRDQAYEFMTRIAATHENVEYYRYLPKEE